MQVFRILFYIIVFSFSTNISAAVSIGGIVLHPSTQKDSDGGKNTFGFEPMIGLTTVLPVFWDQVFIPEVGLIFNSSDADEYSKKTIYALFDLGYKINSNFIFRYGFGWFLTRISGDGGVVVGDNGNGYAPNKTITSYNITWNAGLEYAHNNNYAFKLETYLFQPISSDQRSLSYSLSLNYYY